MSLTIAGVVQLLAVLLRLCGLCEQLLARSGFNVSVLRVQSFMKRIRAACDDQLDALADLQDELDAAQQDVAPGLGFDLSPEAAYLLLEQGQALANL